jgi:hypothetical protein
VEAVPLADDLPTSVPDPQTSAIPFTQTTEPSVRSLPSTSTKLRSFDRGSAWRGTAIASGVLSGAAFGAMVGGVVLLAQSQYQPVWEELSPENARKQQIGTGMLIGSSIGFVAFGALALGASSAAQRAESRRYAWIAPAVDRHTAGLGIGARF